MVLLGAMLGLARNPAAGGLSALPRLLAVSDSLFNEWRKEVGVDKDDVEAFHFDTLYGAIETEEIQFSSTKAATSGRTCDRCPPSRCTMPSST